MTPVRILRSVIFVSLFITLVIIAPREVAATPTALGDIPTGSTNEFAAWVLGWALGVGGGVAFLLILWGGLQILTSSGNPEQVKGGREIITAAITGLLLLIFSAFLLRLIGVDILRIPGL